MLLTDEVLLKTRINFLCGFKGMNIVAWAIQSKWTNEDDDMYFLTILDIYRIQINQKYLPWF